MVNKKGKNILQRYGTDSNIIFAIIGVIGPIAGLIDSVIAPIKGSVWDIILKSITVLFPVIAVILFINKNRSLIKKLENKPIPICFIVHKTIVEAQDSFEKLRKAIDFKNWEDIEGFPNRSSCLWPYTEHRLAPDITEWKNYLASSLGSLRNFVYAVQGNRVYHVAIYGPAALAIGLGAAFGTKYPVVFYHFEKDSYKPVLRLIDDPRLVKEALPAYYQYKYFEFTSTTNCTPDTAVILGGASHSDVAFDNVPLYLREKGKDWTIVEVHNKYGNNLKEEDWIPAVRELFAIIQAILHQKNKINLHLFYSMPVPLGFGLGMALGPFLDITLYNKEPDTYYPVLKLNDLGIIY